MHGGDENAWILEQDVLLETECTRQAQGQFSESHFSMHRGTPTHTLLALLIPQYPEVPGFSLLLYLQAGQNL